MPEYALISIVSEQPMPNVMAVLQDKRYFKYLDFIVSADKDDPSVYDKSFERIYDRLKMFLEKQERIVTKQRPIYPYSLQEVLKVCQDAVDEHKRQGREVVFNITGGTKVMALAAYLCAQRNQIEAIYVESRDRRLITLPQTEDFFEATAHGIIESKENEFDEDLFREIDVHSYVELYGRKIAECTTRFSEEQIARAKIIAEQYPILRGRLSTLRQAIDQQYPQYKAGTIEYFSVKLKNISKKERTSLRVLATSGALSWEDDQDKMDCSPEQSKFLKGVWIEVFVFDALSSSGRFHDVLANVKLEGSDDEWDVMLTVNAIFAIVECKSDAKHLNTRLGKIRSVQRDLGGTYARSFFARSADSKDKEDDVKKQAALYGINKVLNLDEIFDIANIVAEVLNINKK